MKDNESLVVTTDGELAEVPVSMQVYQAIYNDITGKTENITDTYKMYYSVTSNDLINLEKHIGQFCEQYHVKSSSVSLTIFHVKDSKERFSSFERLNTYNVACLSPVERIHIEVNFLIILPKVETPQSYKIKLTLTSGVALVDKHQDDFPSGFPKSILMRAVQKETAEVEIEYVDYIVARSISDLFRTWLEALPETKPNNKIEWWQSRSHFVRQAFGVSFLLITAYFSIAFTGKYFTQTTENMTGLATYLITIFAILVVSRFLGNLIGLRVESAIDNLSSDLYSSINLNAGDKKLASKYVKKRKNSTTTMIKEIAIAFSIGVVSSLVAAYFIL